MGNLLKRIFIKLKENNLFPFLFFLLVSCCLWLLQTLNDDYETEVSFTVSVHGVPSNIELVNPGDIEVNVRLHDRGTVLTGYKMSNAEPIEVKYSSFKYRNGVLSLPVSALKSQVQSRLEVTTSIVQFVDDTLYINVRQNRKLLPVHLIGNIDAAEHYEVTSVEIEPSSVMVAATPDALEKMERIDTEFVVKRYLKASKTITAKLALGGAVSVEPSEVKLHINVSPLKTKKVRVPVTKLNFPLSFHAMWLPSEVEVSFEVSEAQYELVGPSDFSVELDYNDMLNAHGAPVKLKLVTQPSMVKNVELTPSAINTPLL